jgi:predicted house-cleaning noncanonical NTP pyrophosphatase (MazG superfamily)
LARQALRRDELLDGLKTAIQLSKLVRDHIPDLLEAEGKKAEMETLSENDFRRALLEKLVEEAREAQSALPDELVLEVADVLEVLDAVMGTFGLARDEVLSMQQERRETRGGLDKRIQLMSVEVKTKT